MSGSLKLTRVNFVLQKKISICVLPMKNRFYFFFWLPFANWLLIIVFSTFDLAICPIDGYFKSRLPC